MRAPELSDRVASGFYMFCAMSSSRGHDAMNSTTHKLEFYYDGSCTLELGTCDLKTAVKVQQLTTALPLMVFSPVNITPEKFLCSRIASATHTRIQGTLKLDGPRCPQCASKLERLLA